MSGIALAAALATREPPGWAAIAVAALAGLLSLRWAYRIVRGLADLLRPARISGQVLRIVPFGTVGDAESTNRLTLLYESPPLSWLTRRTGAPVVTSDGTGLVPGFFVVLDDGTAPVLQAWRASPRRAGMLRPGDVVDARVQPWTKRLISAAPLPR